MHYYDGNNHRILNLDHFATYKVFTTGEGYEVRAFYATPPPETQNAKPETWEVLCKGSEHECHTFLSKFANLIDAEKIRSTTGAMAMGSVKA